jgi:hypothetical protein
MNELQTRTTKRATITTDVDVDLFIVIAYLYDDKECS